MKVTNILLGIAICGALAQSASAERFFRSRATGNYNAWQTWEFSDNGGSSYSNAPSTGGVGVEYPGAADHVIANTPYIVTVTTTDALADSFDIVSGGTFKIGSSGANGKLAVDGTSDSLHDLAGSLILGNASGSKTGILLFTAVNQTISSTDTGVLSAAFAGSKVQIASGLQLTNKMSMLGLLTMEAETGTATLENYGPSARCDADRSGDFVFESNLTVQDDTTGGSPTYAATASGARMVWKNTADYALLGNFELSHCNANPALDARFYIATGVKVDSNGGSFTNGAGGGPAGQVIFQTQSSANSKLEWSTGTNINVDTDYCP